MLQEAEYIVRTLHFPLPHLNKLWILKKLPWKRPEWKHTPLPVVSAGARTDITQDRSSEYISQSLNLGLRNWKIWCFQKWKKKIHAVLQSSLGGGGETTPKQKNVLIGCLTEKWKKKAILVVEWQGIEIPKKNLQRREKTHSDSLGKQFPFGKIKQEILTHQIWELFTSTQYATYCIYRVSDTKPGNHHVSSKPQSIHC